MTSVSRSRANNATLRHGLQLSSLTSRALYLALGALFFVVVAYLLSAALRTPPTWTLQIGAPGDTRFSSGFFLAEQSESLPFRWSSPDARLVLHGADATPLAIELRINGDQILRSGDARLSLVAEHPAASGLVSTTIHVAQGWQRYHLLLPASAPGIAPPAYALVSGTSRPGPQDGRDLGAALSTVRLMPIENAAGSWLLRGWPLHPRALYFSWMLAVLFGVVTSGLNLLLNAPWRTKAAFSTESAKPSSFVFRLSSTLILLLAIGLILWARTNPYTLAASIPPLPWMLVVLSVALLAGSTVRGIRSLVQAQAVGSQVVLWSGVGLLIVAQALLNGQTLIPLGIALALVALALVVAAERLLPATSRESLVVAQSRWWARPQLLLAGIFALALFLRFYELASLPYGLWRDEARHGLVALRMLDDPNYRPIYVAEGGVNMPALTFYFFALELKWWGIHPWSMRPFTALAGALTVLPLYDLTRRLFGVRPALIAALLYAVSAWHLTVSRFSFSTVFDPLFGLTGLWLLLVAWQSVQPQTEGKTARLPRRASPVWRFAAWFFSGVFMALAIQTYHTGRVVPVIGGLLALGLLWQALRDRQSAVGSQPPEEVQSSGIKGQASGPIVKQWLLGIVVLAVGFLLFAGPMLWYALTREAQFNDRVSGVFLLSEDALKGGAPLAALDTTLGKHLLLFNVRGDENGRHAPPNRPGLDFVSGLGLLLGCAFLIRRTTGGWPGLGWRGLFLVAAIGLSLLPSALAVDAPHGMRGVGSIAFVCIIAALGFEWLRELLQHAGQGTTDERGAATSANRRSAFLLRRSSFIFLAFLIAFALNFYTYFIWMKAAPEVWVSFYPVHTQAGAYVRQLREQDANRQIFVPAGVATNPVFVYLTAGYNVQTFDAGVASEALQPGAIFILSGYTYQKDKENLVQYLGPNPQPLATGPLFPDGRSPAFVAYSALQPAATRP